MGDGDGFYDDGLYDYDDDDGDDDDGDDSGDGDDDDDDGLWAHQKPFARWQCHFDQRMPAKLNSSCDCAQLRSTWIHPQKHWTLNPKSHWVKTLLTSGWSAGPSFHAHLRIDGRMGWED